MSVSVEEFGRLFASFLERVVQQAPEPSSPLLERLREHLGTDPLEAPVTSAKLAAFEHPDLQVALDAYLADGGRAHELIGLGGGHHGMALAEELQHGGGRIGAPSYVERPIDVGRQLSCLQRGVVLVSGGPTPPHVLVVTTEDHGPFESLAVGVLSADAEDGRAALAELRRAMSEHSVYRGKVLTLSNPEGPFGGRNVGAAFLPRPTVDRDAIVLPAGRLELVERRTVGFDAFADRLVAQGQSRKRGILLYGPPGTGKTLTARYLIGRMPERTVIVLTGQALAAIAAAASLARRLEPAMLVLEDVDLVAHDRSFDGTNPVLFELLNALDGLGEDDGDVIVLLTTNRADLLEPALSARPGRVDLAVELPLPDDAERERLLALAVTGIAHEVTDWGPAVARTAGTPASFIRELIRSASLLAAERDATSLGDADIEGALAELLDSGPLNAALLGARWDPERAASGGPGPRHAGGGHGYLETPDATSFVWLGEPDDDGPYLTDEP